MFVRLVGCVGCMLFRVACDCVCGNNVWAWSSASFIVLGAYLCMVQNSSCVSMALLVSFWICGKVVMLYVYSLSRNFWDFALSVSVRLTYMGLDFQANSSWVCLMGNVLFVVVMWISYSFFNKKSVRAMGDLEQACRLSLGRCREPPYLAVMYLVRPW